MKKILLTLTAVAGLTLASKAQEITGFQKGNVIVEGNLGVNTTNDNNSDKKTSNFNFTPKAGYFLSDKFAVGIKVNVGNETEKITNNNAEVKESLSQFGAGVFGRYYFLELGSRFKTYAEVGADYASIKNKNTVAGTTTTDLKGNGFGINGGVGANYFLTDKIAINFAFANIIGYNTAKLDGAKSVNEFGVNLNNFNNFFNTAQFGLTFKF